MVCASPMARCYVTVWWVTAIGFTNTEHHRCHAPPAPSRDPRRGGGAARRSSSANQIADGSDYLYGGSKTVATRLVHCILATSRVGAI